MSVDGNGGIVCNCRYEYDSLWRFVGRVVGRLLIEVLLYVKKSNFVGNVGKVVIGLWFMFNVWSEVGSVGRIEMLFCL